MNAANLRLHWELGEIWRVFEEDEKSRVAVISGTGSTFCVGAEFSVIEKMRSSHQELERQRRHAAAIVENMVASTKPIISAINGAAVGAGLAVALMADIAIMARSARISDGHARLGIAAGDHAALIWPLLIGMSKAKYLLLTADFVDGSEAERIGLVYRCVDDDDLIASADALAEKLARGSSIALRATKRSLNQWFRLLYPIFEHSLESEILNLLSPDAEEGLSAISEKRHPLFPSTTDAQLPHIPE